MFIDLGTYQLDVDPEKTAAFYAKTGSISCTCDGCRNFAKAVANLPVTVLELFLQFGIDPAKPAEICVHCAPSNDTVSYGGFYHICGTIRKGKSPWIQIDPKHFAFDESCRIRLGENFSVFFNDRVHLLEEGFPTPVLQLEIDFTLPWQLPTPNSYTIP